MRDVALFCSVALSCFAFCSCCFCGVGHVTAHAHTKFHEVRARHTPQLPPPPWVWRGVMCVHMCASYQGDAALLHSLQLLCRATGVAPHGGRETRSLVESIEQTRGR